MYIYIYIYIHTHIHMYILYKYIPPLSNLFPRRGSAARRLFGRARRGRHQRSTRTAGKLALSLSLSLSLS